MATAPGLLAQTGEETRRTPIDFPSYAGSFIEASEAGVAQFPPPRLPNETEEQKKVSGPTERDEGLSKEQKVLLLNTAALASIAAYGAAKWDYFQTSARSTPEGWFGRTTKSGGADKLGHLWSTYAASHLLSHIYEEWGYKKTEANALGALSALGIQALMELGDAYSGDFGFSYEDMGMNIVGAGAAFVLGSNPILSSKIDLRVEYKPDSIRDLAGDVFSDYDNQRYLLALKFDGFDSLKDSYLGYLELQGGYFTRGYQRFRPGGPDGRVRSVYVGVGLNVTKLVKKLSNKRLAIFNYLQLPFTSVRIDAGLD